MNDADHESLISATEHHWIIEIIAVFLFLVFYELIIKTLFTIILDFVKSRKYNISGNYIAYFEDQNGIDKVKRYSNLKLTQRGTKIIGRNISGEESNYNKRIWLLEGKLLHGHLITGSYTEVSHRDSRSVGAFFVAQTEGTMDFNGYWSGWDDSNNKINGGEYTFKKREKIFCRSYKEIDKHRIADICERAFGHRYFEVGIESKLTAYKETAQLFVAQRKVEPNNIMGFSFCYMLPKESFNDFLNIHNIANNPVDTQYVKSKITDEMATSDKAGKIAVMQTLCISSEGRNRGIGRDLFQHTEKYLKQFAPTIILSPAWSIDGQMNASKLLRSFGYTDSILIHNYWKLDCDDDKFTCPSRSSGCKCTMSLFKKTL